MSWIQKTNSDYIIVTGDGEPYKVLWKNPLKAIEYNIASFEFPNLPGSRVERGQPKGRKFPLEIYFQGEDHLDHSEAFEQSANDPRPWNVQHPIYGDLVVHPSDLLFDNTGYNTSKITGNLLETIIEDNPKTTVKAQDKIAADKEIFDEIVSRSFANDVKPDTNDIITLTKNTNTIYSEGKKVVKTTDEAEQYFNLFISANGKILNATAKPLEAMREIQAMINYPFQFADSVKNRINAIVNQFNRLNENVLSLFRKSDKKIYESNGGTLISTLAMSSVTPSSSSNSIADEYGNRKEVLNVLNTLVTSYNTYLQNLDTLQTDNGGSQDSYVPDADSMIALNSLINFTVSNLFDIALDSRQERAILLEDDSNVIMLAHRFYSLLPDDSTIDELMKNNNIGLNEYLCVRKGRKIIYYV